MDRFDLWLDRAAKVSCVGSLIAQVVFGTLALHAASRVSQPGAGAGEDHKILWYFGAWILTTLTSALIVLFAFRRPKSPEETTGVESDREDDDTDYKALFVAECDARNKYQDKYTVAANQVLELQAALSRPQTPIKSDLERWCEALAHNDKENITQRVIAVAWEPRRVNERNSHYIEFKITFVNASIFELKSPRLGGIVHFDRHPLPFPPQFGQSFPLARGQKTWISIRQPLTKEIAEDIQARIVNDVLADLHFSDLGITFDVEFPGLPTWQWTWKARDSVSVTAVTIF
jgi:hypothetical protein